MAVAIVPARGGSKEIPRKNIQELGGECLIEWTLDAAKAAKGISRVIVSTDDQEILDVARGAQVEVVRRPAELGADDVHAIHPVIHAIKAMEVDLDEIVVMLLPTSPFRTKDDIDKGLKRFAEKDDPGSVIGVTYVCNMHNLRKYDDENIKPLTNGGLNLQRDLGVPIFRVNGALYISKAITVVVEETFHVENAVSHPMSPWASIDINTQEDLYFCRRIVNGDTDDS